MIALRTILIIGFFALLTCFSARAVNAQTIDVLMNPPCANSTCIGLDMIAVAKHLLVESDPMLSYFEKLSFEVECAPPQLTGADVQKQVPGAIFEFPDTFCTNQGCSPGIGGEACEVTGAAAEFDSRTAVLLPPETNQFRTPDELATDPPVTGDQGIDSVSNRADIPEQFADVEQPFSDFSFSDLEESAEELGLTELFAGVAAAAAATALSEGGDSAPPSCNSTPDTSCQVTPVVNNGKDVRISGQTINSGLGRIRNAENVVIENNNFVNGRGNAFVIDPCSVKNVTIRNNTFRNWAGESGKNAIVYIGWMKNQTECKANITIENNRFIDTTSKWAIETKTSGVVIRGNSANNSKSTIELRHGRDVDVSGNNFPGGYYVFGHGHTLSGNGGGPIRLMHGHQVQNEICSGPAGAVNYPVAREITVHGNTSTITTGNWGGSPLKPTCRGSDCPAALASGNQASVRTGCQ